MLAMYESPNNRLLAALPVADLQRIQEYLAPVLLRPGQSLYEAGSAPSYVYFPSTAIVALLSGMSDGSTSNLAVIGNEGFIGISAFMGGETTLSHAVVQNAGYAYRLPVKVLSREFMRGGTMQSLLLRYTHALFTQMAQTAVCNRHHSLDRQLCRWLLLSLDRLPCNEMQMTQEWIATMLGVRRESVTEAAGRLQSAGIIEYRRGRITILNRVGLERGACACYALVKAECDRLLPKPATRVALPLQAIKPAARPPVTAQTFRAGIASSLSMYAEAQLPTHRLSSEAAT